LFNDVLAQYVSDPDSSFKIAIKQSKSKDYDKAIQTCKQILDKYPNYNDVRLYLGTIYSWNNKYKEARNEFQIIFKKDSNNRELVIAAINNEIWSDNPEKALNIIDNWLKYNAQDTEIMFLKIEALNNLKRYQDALSEIDKILLIDNNNAKALAIKKSIKISHAKNSISINYNIDSYKEYEPRHIFYIDYSRKTPIGTLIGRINYAYRFGDGGYQYEIDAYPKYFKKSYGYINFGYSDALAKIFPKFRFGTDIYYNLPKAFETSFGLRYLKFTSDVTIFTGHVGKYIGNYWLSIRPFITPGSTGTSISGIFQLRKYFSDPKNYLGLSLGYGSSPDDKRDYFNVISRLKSNKIKLEYNTPFLTLWILNINIALANEEFLPEKFHNIYTIGIGLQKTF
jgi:YaiO family outer membrane protein